MSCVIEGFGVRLVVRSPFVAVRAPVWKGPTDDLSVHRLGAGSIAVMPAGSGAEIAVRAGEQGSVAAVSPGPDDRDWRVRLERLSFVLPPMTALLGGEPGDGVEIRFAHVIAPSGIALPDGTKLPYGDDVMVLDPPQWSYLPSEDELARDLPGALAGSGRTLIGISTVPARDGARAVDLAVQGPRGEQRRERSYIVSVGAAHVVRLAISVGAEGADIARSIGDAIVASIRAEPARDDVPSSR